MGEYMISVLAVCALSSVCGLLSYKGGAAERLAFGILVLYTVAMPAMSLAERWDGELRLPDLGGVDTSDPEHGSIAREAFEDGIRRLVCEKYSFPEECVAVKADGFDFEEMRAERIGLLLSGRAALADRKAIEKYVEELGLGRCDAEIEI